MAPLHWLQDNTLTRLQANSARVFRDRDDVSGNKLGMRCEGGCYLDNDPETIETLEMNFIEDDAHWSKSKLRDLLRAFGD